MISIVVYGRNDSYGYNLHKRAALSLNCMAEVLTGDDEILFVDYNTPNDFPTFPEAIRDTLTARACALLRVFRVRPQIHDRHFRGRTPLAVLEGLSRNIAIRRSNPRNRWILSTNADVIFAPRDGRSLTQIASELADGFYGTARFEVPESLWETCDRLNPRQTIDQVRCWGETFHLNEIVRGSDIIRYDAPGDFQLVLRDDLFAIHGFHEAMLRGWHLDSNLCKRLSLLRGAIGDALPHVFNYHCDHTRQVTPKHAHTLMEDPIEDFVDRVAVPGIAEQAASWGRPDEAIEELSLAGGLNADYIRTLEQAVGAPMKTPDEVAMFGPEPVSVAHVLPFLLDHYVNAPRDLKLCWIGPRDDIFARFASSWTSLGFTAMPRVVDPGAPRPPEAFAEAEEFIINFGVPEALPRARALDLYRQIHGLLTEEDGRLASGLSPRRVVGLNGAHADYRELMEAFFNCARAPYSTRLRVGYSAGAPAAAMQWLDRLRTTNAGRREGSAIVTLSEGKWFGEERITFGPYERLRPGTYGAEIAIRDIAGNGPAMGLIGRAARIGQIELVLGNVVRSRHQITLGASLARTVRFPVAIALEDMNSAIEIRVASHGRIRFAIDAVTIRPQTDL